MKPYVLRYMFLKAAVFLSIALSVICAAEAVFGQHLIDELSGKPFSDPSYVQEMSIEWQKQPIVHNPSAEKADLVVSLDQQMYPALKPLIREYADKKNLRIIIKEGTCGISAGMLSSKSVDIGGFCCAPGRTDRLPGLRFHTIGIASIALIVHPDNPINNISMYEARSLFMGDLFRWSELSAINQKDSFNDPVRPIARLHCKIRAGHWRLLLDNEDLFSPDLLEVGAIPDMISQVAQNRGAIGYETMWMTRRFQDRGRVKVLRINGYSPDDTFPLASGHYPLFRTYSLTTWEGKETENPHARELVDYILDAVKGLDDKYSLIPASILRENGWKFRGDEIVGRPHEE